MSAETFNTRTGRLIVGEDGILRAQLLPGAVVTLQDAIDSLASIPTRADGRKQLLLADLRQLKSMSREARAYYASEEPAQILAATALLVASPLSRVIGSFFLGLNKTHMPIKLFTSEHAAIAWLKGFAQ